MHSHRNLLRNANYVLLASKRIFVTTLLLVLILMVLLISLANNSSISIPAMT